MAMKNLLKTVVQAAAKRQQGAIGGADASDVGDGRVASQASFNVMKLNLIGI